MCSDFIFGHSNRAVLARRLLTQDILWLLIYCIHKVKLSLATISPSRDNWLLVKINNNAMVLENVHQSNQALIGTN